MNNQKIIINDPKRELINCNGDYNTKLVDKELEKCRPKKQRSLCNSFLKQLILQIVGQGILWGTFIVTYFCFLGSSDMTNLEKTIASACVGCAVAIVSAVIYTKIVIRRMDKAYLKFEKEKNEKVFKESTLEDEQTTCKTGTSI